MKEVFAQSEDIQININNILGYMSEREFGDIHIKVDPKTNLQAIIAIHSTKLGPALGGCRCIEYHSTADAIYDALRLARGMSYKAALVNLPYGGGKSVLIKPKAIKDKHAYFNKFGEFVNGLGGQYITAVDSGTTLEEMDIIHEKTSYVASLSKHNDEPSPYTAHGVLRGIQAAAKFKLNRDNLTGLHVAIQGIGKVGFSLAKELVERGAKLTIADINEKYCQQAASEFNATVVPIEEIHSVQCDVFSPCALGAVINDATIGQIKAKIIAGAANNQLSRAYHGKVLHENDTLYVPDYVINAGGLIYATTQYEEAPIERANQLIESIYDSLIAIFERSQLDNAPTSMIADKMAREKLA